ncbi:uncharacterized protein LOC118431502 [Branchiostoma floridae]|uniref:Uncharacterized protein LOC118431502 n=1 Tax=Branchiostoma floridae TaxID=7739 RepID=A0A9J7MCK9_BRAFL|nr:uncharacterized protein LOC118431502 [Branchiostoma floridae]
MALWSIVSAFAVFLMHTTAQDANEVCYGDLGCFSGEGPYTNTGKLPASPDQLDTKFYLFSRSNAMLAGRQLLDFDSPSTLQLSSFKFEKPVKVWIHGFTSAKGIADVFSSEVGQAMAETIQKDDVNYIIVDWSKGVQYPDYAAAASNIRVVGAQLAKLITFMVDQTGVSLDQFHLIGYSLGAHLAGEAGKRLPGLARITGLDPAGPMFELADPAVRLNSNAATFVDVIHTDAPSLNVAFGMATPVGDVDFYPNGGARQPDCPDAVTETLSSLVAGTFDVSGLVDGAGCSHHRALDYWIESINSPCSFVAHRCDSYNKYEDGECWDNSDGSYAVMGYNVDPSAQGAMFTSTFGDGSFCGTEFKVSFKTRRYARTTRGQVEATIVGTDASTDKTNLFSSNSQSFEDDRTYGGLFMSRAGVGTVRELRLKFRASEIYRFWSWHGDLKINRIDIQSNTGVTAKEKKKEEEKKKRKENKKEKRNTTNNNRKMKGLSHILYVVVVVVLVADLAEPGKRIRYNTQKGKRLPELRSLPYQDILRVYGKQRQQAQSTRKQPANHGHHTTTVTPATTTTPRLPQVVCYGDLGCFSDEFPFDNTGGVVPQSPEYINTVFYVFTKSNPTIEARQAISYDDILSVQNSPFDPAKPVKVLIHGFYSYPITGDPFWAGDAMREMLKRDDINVIIVDWNKGAEFPNYAQAATNIRLVAAQVAKLITFLVNETGCSLDQFSLVGHSLGAHLSGHVGRRLPGLPRITATVRTRDFYPNGGKGQPGCGNTWLGSITSVFDPNLSLDDVVDCSHNRAYEFYIESINNPCKFVSYPCRSYDDFAAGGCRDCSNNACSVMGYDVDNNMAGRGKQYLNTGDTGPYCRYEYRVTIKTKAGMEHTRGELVAIISGNGQNTGPIQLFNDGSYALDQDTTHTKIVTSTVGIDSIGQLQLTFLATNNILYSWANASDLTIVRIDVTSNSGASVSYCGEMLLRDGVMNTISSFNNCDTIVP